jgi:hypothetical protein
MESQETNFYCWGKQGRSQRKDASDPTGGEKIMKGREKVSNSTGEAM